MKDVQFILYVRNQTRSKKFYGGLFHLKPIMDVPGMTEFQLTDSVKLGLMPEKGIAKILTPTTPHPEKGNGIPRCELYISVNNAAEYLNNGVKLGGKEISPLTNRDWGDKVGYISDPDGHIIAFAEKIKDIT